MNDGQSNDSSWTMVVGGILFAIIIMMALAFGFRWFSTAITSIQISEPAPGVRCASIVTGDGAALHCDWPEQ